MDPSVDSEITPLGRRLFRLVEEYAALGDHRTGTDVDRATVDWLVARLESRGARVTRWPYTLFGGAAEGALLVATPLRQT